MSVQEQGRFCKHCSHVVTDFTGMSDEEVVRFLIQHKNDKVCGHFRNDQLSRLRITVTPAQLQAVNWTVFQQVRIAIFLVFASTLFSCSSAEPKQQAPEIVIEQTDTLINSVTKKDSIPVAISASKLKWNSKRSQELKEEISTVTEIIEVTSGAPEIDYPEIIEVPVIPISPDSIPLNPPK
jgi:hypothetical protein